MYKWKKEEDKKEVIAPQVVYADKTGLYCDLCGELIEDEGEKESKYRRYGTPNKNYKFADTHFVGDIIPVITFHSVLGEYELDVCENCMNELKTKVFRNTEGFVNDRLTRTNIQHITHVHQDLIDTSKRLRDVEDKSAVLSDSLAAILNRYD